MTIALSYDADVDCISLMLIFVHGDPLLHLGIGLALALMTTRPRYMFSK